MDRKTFTWPRIVVAVLAVAALVAETVMLFAASYAPLWQVFAPLAVAVLGGALVALKLHSFSGAAWLSFAALIADVLFMRQHGVLAEWIFCAPALVVLLANILLLDVAATRETIRKSIVSLKRKPSTIPMVMLVVSFLLYSLNLTDLSDTTAKIQGRGMGLSQFCIMLFSMLSMVCMLNAFPRRKKPNIPMIALMYVLFGVIIYCNIHYSNAVLAALTRPESPIKLDATTAYIADAYNMLGTHMVLVILTAVLVALLPVYSRLLRKINTSVTVEDNGSMENIEIED